MKMETSLGNGPEWIPHESRPVVYVAGPFRSDPFAGIRNAIVVADRLEETGIITAWVPHQNAMWDLVCPHTAGFWLDYDLAQLAKSDALLRIPGASEGADDEIDFAREVGMPVFYDEETTILWAKVWLEHRS